MSDETHIDSVLQSKDGKTYTAKIPYPLPEAVLLISPIIPQVDWKPGSGPPEAKFMHQRFRLSQQAGVAPRYLEEGCHTILLSRQACLECSKKETLLFAGPVPQEYEIKDVNWACDDCYRES